MICRLRFCTYIFLTADDVLFSCKCRVVGNSAVANGDLVIKFFAQVNINQVRCLTVQRINIFICYCFAVTIPLIDKTTGELIALELTVIDLRNVPTLLVL